MKNHLLKDISTPKSKVSPTSAHVAHGINIPAVKRIGLFSADEWEEFVEEWAHSLKPAYQSVKRFAGSGDQGRDVVGFCSNTNFQGVWDLYQCKRYEEKLVPSDIWIELGKLIYHTLQDGIKQPRKYLFMAPNGVGLKLQKLLIDPMKLKEQLRQNWPQHCQNEIAVGKEIKLDGELLAYFEAFDFSTFGWMTAPDLIQGHSKTPFHATRFGGGLPPVPTEVVVPDDIQPIESRYITQLFEAYTDNKKQQISCADELVPHSEIKEHFSRSRESFYSAELLRNFARDNVPPGTFEALQDDVYHGVVDTHDMDYPDGLVRLRATVSKASDLPVANSPLNTSTTPKNKNGICHQLANDDRLMWVRKNK
ncbi:MAG: hypothetical protein PHW76_04530 [Alphaproteobacteria bacterium]|nr:hypothetical protein [Alphaproteobacteria bacterium]